MPVNINNKLRHALTGTACYGPITKKLDLKKLDFPEVPIHGRKKKRTLPGRRFGRNDCPFCGEELPIDTSVQVNVPDWRRRFVLPPRMKYCVCGAFEAQFCPACRKPTWQKGLIYQHKKDAWGNCGFYGELKLV